MFEDFIFPAPWMERLGQGRPGPVFFASGSSGTSVDTFRLHTDAMGTLSGPEGHQPEGGRGVGPAGR